MQPTAEKIEAEKFQIIGEDIETTKEPIHPPRTGELWKITLPVVLELAHVLTALITPASSICSLSGRSRRLSNPKANKNCSVVT